MSKPFIHAHGGYCFRRMEGEDVEVYLLNGRTLVCLNAAEWATIIATVSEGGYSSDKYRAALALHRNDERYWSSEFTRLRTLMGKLFHSLSAIQAWLRSPSENPPRFDLMDEALRDAGANQ
jgi:hypothetical protein